MNGAHIGRGCIVGAGCVVSGNTPPYSVVVGNPWRIVKFVFTPEEIVEHEAKLYSEDKRIPLETLQKNYDDWLKTKNRCMKKKILFVIPVYSHGGTNKSLESLLSAIDEKRYEISIFSLYEDGGVFTKIYLTPIS